MDSTIRKTMECPTVCVIIPVYNVAPYVERCVLSVMLQSHPANEFFIVDDASTDYSIALCERLIDKYKGPTQFVILSHDHNRGLSAARNTGTDAATSEYIYYLDSDDEITCDCLEKLISPILTDDTIEMVQGQYMTDYSAMLKWKPKKDVLIKSHFIHPIKYQLDSNENIRSWYYSLKGSKPDQVWNKLLKISFLRKNRLYNKEGLLYEDLLWTHNLLRFVNSVALIDDITYIAHRRPGSIMTDKGKEVFLLHHGYIFKEIASQIAPDNNEDVVLRWVPDFCRCYIDATNNDDYQYVYRTFIYQIKCGNHIAAFIHIVLVHCMGKNIIGRICYKIPLWVWNLGRRIIRFIRN